MANAIMMTGDKEFFLVARGAEMTLKFEAARGEWVMYTVNAAVKAWNRGFAIPKFFRSLEEVEAKYKTWRGIAALAA